MDLTEESLEEALVEAQQLAQNAGEKLFIKPKTYYLPIPVVQDLFDRGYKTRLQILCYLINLESPAKI